MRDHAVLIGVLAGVVVLALIGGLVVRNRLRLAQARRLAGEANARSKRKAGWYTDPYNPSGLRFWNGAHWTGEVRRDDPSASPGARGRDHF